MKATIAAVCVCLQRSAPYYNRGTVYQDLGEAANATADCRKALEIDPDFGQARQALAELAPKPN